MRKGLVVALGVVALLLAVSQAFPVAPVIGAIPDIIVSDKEQNTLTQDRNFFVFSNALILDEYVRDDDTTLSQLKWCFKQSSGSSVTLNRISSYPGTNFRNPGAYDIRAVSQTLSVRNTRFSPVTGLPPFPTPAFTTTDTMIQMVVSDGTGVDSQTVIITTVNTPDSSTTRQGDALVPRKLKTYTFASTAEGWTWYEEPAPPYVSSPSHNTTFSGSLEATEAAAQVPIVYGAWESPKNPTVGIRVRYGTVLRARYLLRGPTGDVCPGFRLRALWSKVIDAGAPYGWVPNFMDPDYNDDLEVVWYTLNPTFISLWVPGREPGTAGKTYTLLYYPQQIESLMSTDSVTYITFDLVDADTYGNDAGTLSCDQVDVDLLDRPNTGTAVPGLTFTNFSSGWTRQISAIPGGTASTVGLQLNLTAAMIQIVQQPGNQWFEASAVSSGSPLTSGRYYRTVFTLTSQQQSGNQGPIIRAGVVSSRLIWTVNKRLKGGGTWSQIGTTAEEYEVWWQAPSPYPQASTQTEAMMIRFESYLTTPPAGKTVAGDLRCTRVDTQSFPVP